MARTKVLRGQVTLVPPLGVHDAQGVKEHTVDEVTGTGGADVASSDEGTTADPRMVGATAAGRLRAVASYLEDRVDDLVAAVPDPSFARSLTDTAMHVRLTADAVEHLCTPTDGAPSGGPTLSLVISSEG